MRTKDKILWNLIRWATIIGIYSFNAWMLLSFIDVVAHNLDPEPVYQWWNLIILIIG